MYKVVFEDNTVFIGGEPNDSKWNEMPDKPIKKIEYYLSKIPIVLENFEAYNHIIERVKFINRPGQRITKIILMGKKKSLVYQLIFDLKKKKMFQEKTLYNKQYTGWKIGIENLKPIIKFN